MTADETKAAVLEKCEHLDGDEYNGYRVYSKDDSRNFVIEDGRYIKLKIKKDADAHEDVWRFAATALLII